MAHTRATPTDAEIANFHTIQSITTWAGVKPEMRAALLAVMGADITEVPKSVALTTDKEWDALLAEVRIGDNEDKRPLSFLAKMNLRLFMRTARVVAGIDEDSSRISSAPMAAEDRCSVKEEPVKLSQVLDQSWDDMAPALSSEAVKALYEAYKKIFERLPPPAKECTVDQLSAVPFRLKSGVPPYADFSVFGPYGSRLNRRLKLKGLQLRSDGEPTQWRSLGHRGSTIG